MKRSTTRMGAPQRGQCQRSQSGGGGSGQRLTAQGGEQGARQGKQLFAITIRQQAVMADAYETHGQDMQEEATQELLGLEGHDTLFSTVPIIAPAEADVFAVESGDAVVLIWPCGG